MKVIVVDDEKSMHGLEFAKRLRDEGRETKIIFVTSHKEYALPGKVIEVIKKLK